MKIAQGIIREAESIHSGYISRVKLAGCKFRINLYDGGCLVWAEAAACLATWKEPRIITA